MSVQNFTIQNEASLSGLPERIKKIIFISVRFPANLSVANNAWCQISKDNETKASWLIYHFDKAHALFHAIRLGPKFVNDIVIQKLLEKGAIISRYFIQRFLLSFGSYDPKLIEMKIEHNVGGSIDSDQIRKVQQKCAVPWGSDTPLSVFTYLLLESSKKLNPINESVHNHDLAVKGNDMEAFHFLTGGPYAINQAKQKLEDNLNAIKDLITIWKFIPFPPRPKHKHYEGKNLEEYPAKDGFENYRQLNIIARAILIHEELVNCWKEIGYDGIVDDVNDLVIQGALLLLFPPSPAKDYETPSVESITKRLQRLLDLGFKPTNAVILDILQLFENRLSGIGKEIIHAFMSVRRNEEHNEFYKMVITEAIKPERIVKKIEILNFLDEMSGSESSKVFKDAMEHIKEKNSIDRKKNTNHTDHIEVNHFEHSSQPENGCHSTTDSDTNKSNSSVKTMSVVPYKPLLYNLTFYNWVLIKFSADSDIAQFAFDDILETRKSFNEKSSKKFENKFIETSNIYKVYCNTRNFFSVKHLELLKKVSHEDILYPLFKFYLPDLFGLSYTFKMPMQIIDDSNIYFKPKRKKKKRSISKEEKLGWINALESIHKEIVDQGNSTEMSTEFVNCLEEFYDRLEEIYDDLKMELESSTNTKTKKHKVGKNQKRNKDPISNNIIFDDKELYIYDIADDSNS